MIWSLELKPLKTPVNFTTWEPDASEKRLNLGSNVKLSQSMEIPFQSAANKCYHTMSALAAEFSWIW